MAKKAPAKKAPAKRKPAKKAPVQPDSPFELSEFSPGTIRELRKILDGEKAVIDQAIKEAETHLVKPAEKSSSPWRRSMLVAATAAGLVVSFLGGVWSAGGWQIGPEPQKSDSVSKVFDTQEAAFRKRNGELAVKLKAGEFPSEDAAKNWMTENYIPDSEAAWVVLLQEEAAAFGGKEWTAEKHAAHVERYAR